MLLPGNLLGLGLRAHHLQLIDDAVRHENRLVGGSSCGLGPAGGRLRRLLGGRGELAVPGVLEDGRERLSLLSLIRERPEGVPLVGAGVLGNLGLLLAELNRHGRLVGLIESALATRRADLAVKPEGRLGRLAVAHAVGAMRANQIGQGQLLPAGSVGALRDRDNDGLIVGVLHRGGKLVIAKLASDLATGTGGNPATVVEGGAGRSSVAGDGSARHVERLNLRSSKAFARLGSASTKYTKKYFNFLENTQKRFKIL